MDVLNMGQEMRALVKVIPAMRALEAPHTAMRLLMTVEMPRVTEGLAAGRADIHLRLLVDDLDMSLQVSAHLEPRRTDRAHVLPLVISARRTAGSARLWHRPGPWRRGSFKRKRNLRSENRR
jgi:hypothetical protein